MPAVDVGLTASGDLPAEPRHVSGVDLVAQRLALVLRTARGEVVLDRFAGLPLLDWRSRKPAPLVEIDATLRSVISSTPGVVRVSSLTTTHDTATRTVSVDATLMVDDGRGTLQAVAVRGSLAGNATPAVIAYEALGPLAP